MTKMTPILSGEKIVGALIKRPLVNEYGSLYGREYVVYAKPGERTPMLMQGVEASLKAQGIEHNTDDLWDQTVIFWGVTPEI